MSNWFRTYGFAEILERFLIGAYPTDADDVRLLQWMGVKRVLNLVEDQEYGRGERQAVQDALREAEIDELRIQLPDFGGVSVDQLEEAVSIVSLWLNQGLTTYVHCRAGWQRSAVVAAAVAALRQDIDVEDALRFVKQAKPSADPLPHQREDLLRWWQERSAS